jgi:hypothetical protein
VGAAKDPPCRAKKRKKEIKGSNEKSLQTQEIGKDMTDTEKYEMIGKLIDSPTRHEMARAFFVCAAPGGPVRLIENGLRVEIHERYCSMADDGREIEVATECSKAIDMTVAEFCKLLIDLVYAGGMEIYWPGEKGVSFHIRGWTDMPIK